MTAYLHDALVYASEDEFLGAVVPFLAAGVAAGQPTFAVLSPGRVEAARALLPEDAAVVWMDAAERYDRPAVALRTYQQMLDDLRQDGAGRVRVAGEMPAGHWDGWARYEAAINRAFDDFPLWALCIYDRRRLTEGQADDVRRTHPRLAAADGRRTVSAEFTDPDVFLAEHRPVPPDPVQLLPPYAELIDPVPAVARQAVRAAGGGGVIPEDELASLVVAVSEVVTNAMLHGRPPIVTRVWRGAGRIVVTVTDAGTGPSDPYAGLLPLSPTATSGRGLWITFQTVDRVDSWRDDDGYTVRLIAR